MNYGSLMTQIPGELPAALGALSTGTVATIVFLGFAATCVVVVVQIGRLLNQRRREQFKLWAEGVGLVYNPGPNPLMREAFHHFKCLDLGERDRAAWHIATGDRGGYEVTAFEYRATSQTAGGSFKEYLTVIIIQPPFPLGSLLLRPRNTLDRMLSLVGMPEVDAGTPELAKMYHVECDDVEWARDVLTPTVCGQLLSDTVLPIAMDGKHAIIWQVGRATPERYDTLMLTLEGMLDRMRPRDA